MAMNINNVRTTATAAVLDALTELYENSDADSMRDFAEAIAEAAVVAVQHVIDRAEVEVTGESIR